jgi:hypothetical protein
MGTEAINILLLPERKPADIDQRITRRRGIIRRREYFVGWDTSSRRTK